MDSRLWTKRIRFVLLGLLCAMLVPGGLPLRAQAPDETLTLEVIPAWEGYVRHSWWTEARVVLRNEGADWHGDLVIRDTQNQITYRQALELPSHSHKQYRLPIFIGNNATPIIALHDTSGVVQQERRVAGRGTLETGRAIALVDTRDAFAREELGETDALIWLPGLAGLPETPMAWDVIDVLLLNGIATADLTTAQQEALLAWVAAGGHLIVGGGPALGQTLAHLPEALRIATPGSVRQFESIADEWTALYDVAATPMRLGAGAMPLAMAEGEIVAARRTTGKGVVDIVGWDMTHSGGATWLAQLWASDPLPAVSTTGSDQALSSGGPNSGMLFRIPFATMPRLWPWLLLFPLYVFLMGPGTLLLVKRLKRPILAWIFIPVWICGAITILALGLSSAFSQTFPLVHEIAIISVPDTTLPARVVQGTAVYAPRTRWLTWNASGIQRPLLGGFRSDTWYNEGDPFPVEVWQGNATHFLDAVATLQIRNPLGVITWGTEGLYDSPDLTTDLRLTSQKDGSDALHITGEVWSEVTLRDVSLLMGSASYGITLTESITQGTAVTVSRPITATYPIYYYSGYIANFCGTMSNYAPYAIYPSVPTVYAVPSATTCYLTGLMDGVPFPAQGLGGIEHRESCVSYTIPCPTQPPGKLTVALEAATNKVENGWIDTTTDIFYVYASGATLHYVLPVYFQIQEIETLTIAVLPTPTAGASKSLTAISELSLWNWEEQTWMNYPPAEAGQAPQSRIVLTGETAQHVFDAQQGVRVRIDTRDTMTGRLLLTLEGTP